MWIFALLVIAPLAAIAWVDIYDKTAHCRCDNASLLRLDALPIDVTRKLVGLKGSHRWRTTVTFEDGFRYISHKTDVEERFISYSISVSAKTHKEIILDAILAHRRAVEKRDRNVKK